MKAIADIENTIGFRELKVFGDLQNVLKEFEKYNYQNVSLEIEEDQEENLLISLKMNEILYYQVRFSYDDFQISSVPKFEKMKLYILDDHYYTSNSNLIGEKFDAYKLEKLMDDIAKDGLNNYKLMIKGDYDQITFTLYKEFTIIREYEILGSINDKFGWSRCPPIRGEFWIKSRKDNVELSIISAKL